MSNAVFDRAVDQMLLSLGARPSPELTLAFTSAVERENLCLSCGAKAAEQMLSMLKRRPFPADLVESTKDVQNQTTEHVTHIADREALGAGDLHAWWITQAPVMVRVAWPELTSDQAVEIAKRLESLGYVSTDPKAIAHELGYVDQYGASPERQWWLDMYPETHTISVDPAVPVGDR